MAVRIPIETAVEEIFVKGSRFIAEACFVKDRAEADFIIKQKKNEHPKASHVVSAFCLGPTGKEILGMSDDGEPKGTAGRPALEVLKGRELTSTLVTIIRYFGGTKLGTGGLVKAYGDSAKAVLDILKTEELISKTRFSFHCNYNLITLIDIAIDECGAQIVDRQFDTGVDYEIEIADTDIPKIERRLEDISNGLISLTKI